MSGRLKQTFLAFEAAHYRRYFVANTISSFGTWMQRLGISWLVYRLTGSANWLAIITFAGWFSSFLLMPYAGAVLDGGHRRKILVFSQILGFGQAMTMAVLTLTGHISVLWIFFLSLLLGMTNAFDMPGRHSFINDMFNDRRMLANAIALNSTGFNMARMVGPALAGIIVAVYGEGICFLLNSFSYLPFAWVLATMTLERENIGQVAAGAVGKESESFMVRIIDGLRYSYRHKLIFPMLVLLGVSSFMGMSVHMVLFPVIADRMLGGGATTLGYLTGAMGFGAIIAALGLASRRKLEGIQRLPPAAFMIYGISTIAMAYCKSLFAAMPFAALMGACIVMGWSSSNTLLQTITERDKISRVMSLSSMSFTGMSPAGGLFMGWLSTQTSTPTAMVVGGVFCIISSLSCAMRIRHIRPEFNK
ncbi:MAG TPA: MFS transporter [Candidatus Rifleibacterium sp.]|nr:MFS transporter [Candidatus Rifleibacterium sp.]HPT47560.1 MFS transporter [Candidatus Rifleibacterium sp.]